MSLGSTNKARMLKYYLGLMLCCFCFNTSATQSITVAVATNFKPVLSELTSRFTKQSNIKVRISSASTGVLYNQIRQGAPFDVFLSADSARPLLLEQQNLIVENTRATFALGQLVLVSNDKSQPASESLLTQWQGKLAIANPSIAPYGLAAKQTLIHLNLWPWGQGDKTKLIRGNSVAQTYQFAHTGNVKLALIAHAQVKSNTFAGGFWLVPSKMHQPIEQQLVVLKASKKLLLANRFVHWLLDVKQQQFITTQGYAIVSER